MPRRQHDSDDEEVDNGHGELLMFTSGPLSRKVARCYFSSCTMGDLNSTTLFQGSSQRRPRLVSLHKPLASRVEDIGEDLSAFSVPPQAPSGGALGFDGDGESDEEEYGEEEEGGGEQGEGEGTGGGPQSGPPDAAEGNAAAAARPPRGPHPLSDYLSPFVNTTELEGLHPIDDVVDEFRRSIEACDRFQGMLTVLDGMEAYGGLGSRVLMACREEMGHFPTTTHLIWSTAGIRPPQEGPTVEAMLGLGPTRGERLRGLNLGFGLYDTAEHTNTLTPIDTAAWRSPIMNGCSSPLSPFDTGVVGEVATCIAAALETAYLPTRIPTDSPTGGSLPLGQILSCLRKTYTSMNLVSLFAALPFPILPSDTAVQALAKHPLLAPSAFMGLTHTIDVSSDPIEEFQLRANADRSSCLTNFNSFRGGLHGLELGEVPTPGFTRKVGSLGEALIFYSGQLPSQVQRTVYNYNNYPLSTRYPEACIDGRVGETGYLLGKPAEVTLAYEYPAAASLACTPSLGAPLKSWCKGFTSTNLRMVPDYGRGQDEWRDAKEWLDTKIDDYTPETFEESDGDISD